MRNITCKTTPVSRALGHTAIGGAAYRAGENLKARGQGPDGGDKWFRYGNRSIVVREAFIMTPKGAPDYAADRSELWNRVEEMENRKNSRLGRELQLGLAYELSHDEQRALIKEFVNREFISRGFVADVSIHNYGRTLPAMGGPDALRHKLRELAEIGVPFLERDEAQGVQSEHVLTLRNRDGEVTGYKLYQPHCHIRITPRACDNGEWINNKEASRYFNKHETAMHWRYDWPKLQNGYLERAGSDVRVTSTSRDEDDFPGIPRKAESQDRQIRAIDERLHELSSEARQRHEQAKEASAADREFKQMHNEALRSGFISQQRETRAGADAFSERQYRLALFFKHVSQRLGQMSERLPEQASQWLARFESMQTRLRVWLGYELPQHAEQRQPDDRRDTHHVTRGYEPPDREPER